MCVWVDFAVASRAPASRDREAFAQVRPTRRKPSEAIGDDDANWVEATIEISAAAFSGSYVALLRAEDFVRFSDALRPLHGDLTGTATFSTMEEWLRIEVTGDGKGHFIAACSAIDRLGGGNRLEFEIAFDQTEAPAILRGLQTICDVFPVVGRNRES